MKPNRATRRAKQRAWDATHPYVTIRPRTLTEPAGHFVGKDRVEEGRRLVRDPKGRLRAAPVVPP